MVDDTFLEQEILKLTDWHTEDLFHSPGDEMITAGGLSKLFSHCSVKAIFHRIKNGKIAKPATVLTLRHRIAPYILEKGTDLRHIQALLGPSWRMTTETYARMSAQRHWAKSEARLDLDI